MKECPKCKSNDVMFIPWSGGMIWECKKCSYKGPLISEKDD